MSEVLLDWYKAERARIYSRSSARPGAILMGGMIWGEKYLDRFARWCVPSLLAPENVAALAGQTRIVIYTTPADTDGLCKITRPLESCGIEIEFHALPIDHGKLKVQFLLAAVQRALLARAAHDMMGFHPLFPDHTYSARFMPNLVGLTGEHQAIAQMTISGQLETAAADLNAHRSNGILKIPARDLGSIANAHFHQQTKPFVLNDLPPGQMAPTPYFVWRLADRLIIHCCHMNPEWMSPQVCQNVPEPNASTIVGALDCSLPYVFPEQWFTPGLEHEMTCIEFSDADKPKRTSGPIEDMTDLAWHVMRFGNDYEPFLCRQSVIPLHPHDGNVVTEADVNIQFDEILRYMLSHRRRMAEESIQQRAKEIGWLKPHEALPYSRFKQAQRRAALL